MWHPAKGKRCDTARRRNAVCLILFAHLCRADLPLVLLANRDEFLARPSAALAPWAEAPGVAGGRDLVAGGSWLGVGRDGRWAAVTNVREGERTPPGGASRGWLVRDYLRGSSSPGEFASQLVPRGADYAGFNLLLGAIDEIWYVSNRSAAPARLPPGCYGLSNGRLDTPWPKVVGGKTALDRLLQQPQVTIEAGFRLLADTTPASDRELPATGVPLAWERALSATFIVAPAYAYGTRSSSVLLRAARGTTWLAERAFTDGPTCWYQTTLLLGEATGGVWRPPAAP
jgi:uncharacterized protein with NRDE domain